MQARMRQWSLVSVVALGLVVAFGGAGIAQSDSNIGTWKLNLAKSKYDPGPAPVSETRVYEVWEKDGLKATFTRVGADGKTVTQGYALHYDGKDYPFTGSPDFDVIALKRLDANTTEATLKKAGKVVQTTRTVISNGGKTRTQNAKGTDAQGRAFNNVAVFDKQ